MEVGEGVCIEVPTTSHGYLSPVTSVPMVSHWLDCLYLYLYILISDGFRLQLRSGTKHSLLPKPYLYHFVEESNIICVCSWSFQADTQPPTVGGCRCLKWVEVFKDTNMDDCDHDCLHNPDPNYQDQSGNHSVAVTFV